MLYKKYSFILGFLHILLLQTVLSREQNKYNNKKHELSTDTQEPNEPDELSTDTQEPNEPDELSTDAQEPNEPDELSTDAQETNETDELNTDIQETNVTDENNVTKEPIKSYKRKGKKEDEGYFDSYDDEEAEHRPYKIVTEIVKQKNILYPEKDEDVVVTRRIYTTEETTTETTTTPTTKPYPMYYGSWDITKNVTRRYTIADRMVLSDRLLIANLSYDIASETYLTIHQVDEMKRDHKKSIGFQAGMLLGRLREKYRKMMALYEDLVTRIWWQGQPPRTTLLNANMNPYHLRFPTYVFVIQYMFIREIELEIDNLCELLESMAEFLNADKLPLRTNLDMEKAINEKLKIAKRRMNEFKKMSRQTYLRQKLGLPPNATIPNRHFEKGWPKEELDVESL